MYDVILVRVMDHLDFALLLEGATTKHRLSRRER
jgi:hypothetical protein